MSALLDQLQIASPCQAKWEDMTGDDKVRFCSQCQKNVFNISNMDAAKAESLIVQKQGRLCLRMYRRHDGTVITQDCPVGLAKIKDKGRAMLYAAATLMAGAVGLFLGLFVPQKWKQPLEDRLVQKMTTPFEKPPVISVTMGTPPPLNSGRAITGIVALPTSNPQETTEESP
jgi:hypothetical protein